MISICKSARFVMLGAAAALSGLIACEVNAAALGDQTAECDRRCLEAFVGRYFEAMIQRDPAKLPGAADARYTENTVPMKTGQGLWKTFSAPGKYHIYAADPKSGQIGYMGTILENGHMVILALRLKVVAGKLQEAEASVHRQEEEAKALEAFGEPDPLWKATVAEPVEPDALISTAGTYFNGLLAHNGKLVPFSKDCNRIVDGAQDTNNPKDRGFVFGSYNPAELSCTDNLSSPVWSYIHSIEPRRFAIVDEERGLVLVVLMFNHPGNVVSASVKGVGVVPMPSQVTRPSTVQIVDLFKIQDRKIARLEAVSVVLPYLQPDPWSLPVHGRE